MKKSLLIFMTALFCFSCNAQNHDTKKTNSKASIANSVSPTEGSWKVEKEFDDNGNLIKYDSIYSWSSNYSLDHFSPAERDSLMQSLKARFFTNFSNFEDKGFDDSFSKDSLFSNFYFNDDFFESDFGEDYRNIDKLKQEMLARQKKYLEKYQSEFIKPEDGD